MKQNILYNAGLLLVMEYILDSISTFTQVKDPSCCSSAGITTISNIFNFQGAVNTWDRCTG